MNRRTLELQMCNCAFARGISQNRSENISGRGVSHKTLFHTARWGVITEQKAGSNEKSRIPTLNMPNEKEEKWIRDDGRHLASLKYYQTVLTIIIQIKSHILHLKVYKLELKLARRLESYI